MIVLVNRTAAGDTVPVAYRVVTGLAVLRGSEPIGSKAICISAGVGLVPAGAVPRSPAGH